MGVPLVSGSVRLIPRLMPTTAMAATAMVVLATAMARGLLIPRLMPTMAMAGLAMATARGLLTLRPMLTTGMVDTVLAMEATAMVVSATAMARGPPMPTMAMVD